MTNESSDTIKNGTRNPVGMLGLGIMGSAIARNLVSKGHTVVGFDPDAARRQEATSLGVSMCQNSVEVSKLCEIVLLSLPDSSALDDSVSAIVQEPDLHNAGRILVELSTLDIESKTRNRDRLADVGLGF